MKSLLLFVSALLIPFHTMADPTEASQNMSANEAVSSFVEALQKHYTQQVKEVRVEETTEQRTRVTIYFNNDSLSQEMTLVGSQQAFYNELEHRRSQPQQSDKEHIAIEFIGNSGVGYKDPDLMRKQVESILRSIAPKGEASINHRFYNLYLGGSLDGIGELYDFLEQFRNSPYGVINKQNSQVVGLISEAIQKYFKYGSIALRQSLLFLFPKTPLELSDKSTEYRLHNSDIETSETVRVLQKTRASESHLVVVEGGLFGLKEAMSFILQPGEEGGPRHTVHLAVGAQGKKATLMNSGFKAATQLAWLLHTLKLTAENRELLPNHANLRFVVNEILPDGRLVDYASVEEFFERSDYAKQVEQDMRRSEDWLKFEKVPDEMARFHKGHFSRKVTEFAYFDSNTSMAETLDQLRLVAFRETMNVFEDVYKDVQSSIEARIPKAFKRGDIINYTHLKRAKGQLNLELVHPFNSLKSQINGRINHNFGRRPLASPLCKFLF